MMQHLPPQQQSGCGEKHNAFVLHLMFQRQGRLSIDMIEHSKNDTFFWLDVGSASQTGTSKPAQNDRLVLAGKGVFIIVN